MLKVLSIKDFEVVTSPFEISTAIAVEAINDSQYFFAELAAMSPVQRVRTIEGMAASLAGYSSICEQGARRHCPDIESTAAAFLTLYAAVLKLTQVECLPVAPQPGLSRLFKKTRKVFVPAYQPRGLAHGVSERLFATPIEVLPATVAQEAQYLLDIEPATGGTLDYSLAALQLFDCTLRKLGVWDITSRPMVALTERALA